VVLNRLDGTMRLIVGLLYGAGLRLRECLELRVKDIDFATNQIVVRRARAERSRHRTTRLSASRLPSGEMSNVDYGPDVTLSRESMSRSMSTAASTWHRPTLATIPAGAAFGSWDRCTDWRRAKCSAG
jgi:integrase